MACPACECLGDALHPLVAPALRVTQPSNDVMRAPPENPVTYTRPASVHTRAATWSITSLAYPTRRGAALHGDIPAPVHSVQRRDDNRSLVLTISSPLLLASAADDPPLP